MKRRFKTEREGLTALAEAQRRSERGLEAMPKRHTMAELFDAWLAQLRQRVDHGERSPNTWSRRDESVRNHLAPMLGRIDVRRLTVQDVERYLDSLDAAAATRASHRAFIRRALNVAMKWGWVEQNVAAYSEPIAARPREVPALALADAQALIDALKGSPLHSAFVTALFTGLRAGELAGLRVEDIDLRAGSTRIHQQVRRNPITRGIEVAPLKTYASAARIELIPAVIAVLQDQIGDRTEGYVWESEPGKPYWTTSLSRAFRSAVKRAGLPPMRLHDLRHLFISFLPQLDVHPAVAQKLARHATIATTMNVYTSIEDSLQKQAMGRLHEALSTRVGPSTGPQGPEKLRAIG